ncbi:hypothetical protein PoB_002275400 [Plakobranchus ocellatus]|uniref:Uncharacterized protein n=1 Tax=Plakobranchus ocellatus TaxID=259542 RepID=A0AAV3ZQV4_9GAST|nr:hypothetical protein PoB_002275400 [Plakobranchus ocellatus]
MTKHNTFFFGRQRDPNLGDDAQSSESVCCRLTAFRLSDKTIAVYSVGARLPSDSSSGDGYTVNSINTEKAAREGRRSGRFLFYKEQTHGELEKKRQLTNCIKVTHNHSDSVKTWQGENPNTMIILQWDGITIVCAITVKSLAHYKKAVPGFQAPSGQGVGGGAKTCDQKGPLTIVLPKPQVHSPPLCH